jgi:hypothetical protein
MRYVVGFVLALAALPTSATAQVDQETATGEKVELALIPERPQKRQPDYGCEHHPAPTSADDDPAPELNTHEKKVRNATPSPMGLCTVAACVLSHGRRV